jgi:hypothetical protein
MKGASMEAGSGSASSMSTERSRLASARHCCGSASRSRSGASLASRRPAQKDPKASQGVPSAASTSCGSMAFHRSRYGIDCTTMP